MMAEAKDWLEKAEKDLMAAEINTRQALFEVAAFLCQQAAEKALKAVYISKFKRLWKVHDLKELAVKVGAGRGLLVKCDALNPHYIATRYPIDMDYTKSIAEDAFKNAKEVVEWAKAELMKK